MKRIFDAVCKNEKCLEFNNVIEVFKQTNDDFPLCKSCGIVLTQTHTKSASFEISGGGVYKSGMSLSI